MEDLEQIAELAEQLGYDPLGWGDKDPEFPEALKKFRVENKATAAWAMGKLAGYANQQRENDAIADQQITPLLQKIEAIKAWAREENDKLEGSVNYFTGQLRTWHMSLIGADPNDDEAWDKEKNKTVSLPDGKVSVRKGSYSTLIENNAALHSWANSNRPDLLVVTLASDTKSRVAKHIEETGEVPPGVKYERSQPKFEVKPAVGE